MFQIYTCESRNPRPLWKDPKFYVAVLSGSAASVLLQRLAAWWWSGA